MVAPVVAIFIFMRQIHGRDDSEMFGTSFFREPDLAIGTLETPKRQSFRNQSPKGVCRASLRIFLDFLYNHAKSPRQGTTDD